jgi:hypothetical protein
MTKMQKEYTVAINTPVLIALFSLVFGAFSFCIKYETRVSRLEEAVISQAADIKYIREKLDQLFTPGHIPMNIKDEALYNSYTARMKDLSSRLEHDSFMPEDKRLRLLEELKQLIENRSKLSENH